MNTAQNKWREALDRAERAEKRVKLLEEGVQFQHDRRGHSLYRKDPGSWKICQMSSCVKFQAALVGED